MCLYKFEDPNVCPKVHNASRSFVFLTVGRAAFVCFKLCVSRCPNVSWRTSALTLLGSHWDKFDKEGESESEEEKARKGKRRTQDADNICKEHVHEAMPWQTAISHFSADASTHSHVSTCLELFWWTIFRGNCWEVVFARSPTWLSQNTKIVKTLG